MSALTRYSLFFAYCGIFAAGAAGCGEQQIAAAVIGALGGDGGCIGGCASGCIGGCGSCGGCSSCSACNCGSCGSCATCTSIPGGFRGAHAIGPTKSTVPNAATVRLTRSGLAFLGQQIPTLVGGMIPTIPIDQTVDLTVLGAGRTYRLEGTIALGLEGPGGRDTPPELTTTTANDEYTGSGAHDAVKARFGVFYKSCTPGVACTAADDVSSPLRLTARAYVLGIEVSSWTCSAEINSRGLKAGNMRPNLPIDVSLGAIRQPARPDQDLSRLAILGVNTDQDANGRAAGLEGADVDYQCGDPWVDVSQVLDGNGWAGVRDQLGTILDEQVKRRVIPLLCQSAGTAPSNGVCPAGTSKCSAAGYDDFCKSNTDPSTCADAAAALCPTGTTYCRAGNFNGVSPATSHGAYCALGTSVGGTCNDYPMPACLAPRLGTEARVDLGSAEAAISAGIVAVVDLFANAGDFDVTTMIRSGTDAGHTTSGGFNVDLMMGLENLAHNDCVPVTPAPPIPVLHDIESLRTDVTPRGRTVQGAGLGVTTTFANYALWKLFDSGAMCLDVGTPIAPTGLTPSLLANVGFLFQDPSRFLFPLSPTDHGKTFMAVALRPQKAPTVDVATSDNADQGKYPGGTTIDASVRFEDLEIDFLFYTQDRYLRAATLHTNLAVDLKVSMETGVATIRLGSITFPTARWVDSPLLSDADLARAGDHYAVQDSIERLAKTAVDVIGGSALPVKLDVNQLVHAPLRDLFCGGASSGTKAGVGLDLHDDALQTFDDSGQVGVGVFVDLAAETYDCTLPIRGAIDTTLRITNVEIPTDVSTFHAASIGRHGRPRVEIAMSASGTSGVAYEYSYRTALSVWSDWSESPYAVIDRSSLLLQGEQTIYARARVKGVPDSLDETPATATFTIDVTAPLLQASADGRGVVELQAVDFVDGADALEYRTRAPGEAFTEWRPLGRNVVDLGAMDPSSTIEVRDSSGNVASNEAPLGGQTPPSIATGGGCGSCTTAGRTSAANGTPPLLASVALAILVVARRRRGLR